MGSRDSEVLQVPPAAIGARKHCPNQPTIAPSHEAQAGIPHEISSDCFT
jgi:hypothetical protein